MTTLVFRPVHKIIVVDGCMSTIILSEIDLIPRSKWQDDIGFENYELHPKLFSIVNLGNVFIFNLPLKVTVGQI